LPVTTEPARSRALLTGISSRAWEHPADRGALIALRKLKGFDTVLKALSGLFNERRYRLVFLGSAVRVDERQFPRLHRLLTEAGQALDVDELPEMFVANSPFANAVTLGMEKPFIVLHSRLLTLLDDDELRFIIAHELGHAVSGHAVYQTLLVRILNATGLFSSLPPWGLTLRILQAALYEWSRKAELSADRAGLLATQDTAAAFRVHMKLAGGSNDLAEQDLTSFFAQGQEYLDAGDVRDVILKIQLVESQSHPYAVVRAIELRNWVDSGAYTSILGGQYPRRDEDAAAGVSEAAKEAAASYTEQFGSMQDAAGKLVHDIAGLLGSAKGWIDEQLRRTRGGDEDSP
jgi:Zn-dependent protease with chaperone function